MGIFNSNKIKEEIAVKTVPKDSNGYHCINCKYCIPTGNGNYECQFSKPMQIIKNEIVTKEYFICKGKNFESK